MDTDWTDPATLPALTTCKILLVYTCIPMLLRVQAYLCFFPHSVCLLLHAAATCYVSKSTALVNPRRACAARVKVVVLCVCVCVCVCLCVQAAHLRLTQLSDKLDILTDLVSWWLQNEFGVFGFVSKIAIAFPYLRPHGSQPFLYAHFPHSFRILRS